jgi:hypothetical protein
LTEERAQELAETAGALTGGRKGRFGVAALIGIANHFAGRK